MPVPPGAYVGEQDGLSSLTQVRNLSTFDPTAKRILASSAQNASGVGSPRLISNIFGVIPSGIFSAQNFGFPVIRLTVKATGLPTVSTFGVPKVGGPIQTLSTTSITSSAAFGVPKLVKTLKPVGLTSTVALGVPHLNLTVKTVGISSAQAFGLARLVQTFTTVSIGSAQAFGTAQVIETVKPAGISTAQALGTPALARILKPTGIPSAQAFGTVSIAQMVRPVGISSGVLIGASQVNMTVKVGAGVASGQALGAPSINQLITPPGIASGEHVGSPLIQGTSPTQTIVAVGIVSAQAFGNTNLNLTLKPTGVASGSVFGTPSAVKTVQPVGIASAETLGLTALTQTVKPPGIVSGQAFGTPSISKILKPTAIASSQAFGAPNVSLSGISASGTNYEFTATEFRLNNPTTSKYHTLYVVGTTGIEQFEWDAGNISAPGGALASSGHYEFTAGGKFRLKNNDTGLYHEFWLEGSIGSEYLVIGPSGASNPGVILGQGLLYKFENGTFYILNLSLGLWYPLHFIGTLGAEQLEYGQATVGAILPPGITSQQAFGTPIVSNSGVPSSGSNYEFTPTEFRLENSGLAKYYTFYVVGASGLEQLEWITPGFNSTPGNPLISGAHYEFSTSARFRVKNVDTGLYHELWLEGATNAEQLIIGPGSAAAPGVIVSSGPLFRFAGAAFYILNITNSLWYPVDFTGPVGGEQFEYGVGGP
jgi:hypothetical protein